MKEETLASDTFKDLNISVGQLERVLMLQLENLPKRIPPFVNKTIYDWAGASLSGSRELFDTNSSTFVAELATLARMHFENCVNSVWLLQKKTRARYASFVFSSIDEDERSAGWISKIVKGSNSIYSRDAIGELSAIKSKPKDKLAYAKTLRLNINQIPRYPNLRDRCTEIGEYWEYGYITRYRQAAGWSHGNINTLIHFPNSPFMSDDTHGTGLRIFESIRMYIWEVLVLWNLVREIDEIIGGNKYTKRLERINERISIAVESNMIFSDHIGKY